MSIGETLARARHQAGLSVAQVSEQTRIRPLIIRGVEADDYSMCGGDFYARGNIRDIAEVVGTDSEPLIEEYDRDHRAGRPGRRDQPRRAARPFDAATAVAAVAPAARVHDGVRGGGCSHRARVRRVPADGIAEAAARA